MSDEIPKELTLQMGRQGEHGILQQWCLTPSTFQARVPDPGRGAGFFGSRAVYDIYRGIFPCGRFSQRHG